MGIEKTKDGIRNFRNRERLNQTELAKKLGVKSQNVSKWESGESKVENFPSFKTAAKLIEMGITVEELFGEEYEKMHNLIKRDILTENNKLDFIMKEILSMKSDIAELKNPKKGIVKAG